jgi:hypothetical protein
MKQRRAEEKPWGDQQKGWGNNVAERIKED